MLGKEKISECSWNFPVESTKRHLTSPTGINLSCCLQRKLLNLSPQCFHQGSSQKHILLSISPSSRLCRKMQVSRMSHCVCTNSLSTMILSSPGNAEYLFKLQILILGQPLRIEDLKPYLCATWRPNAELEIGTWFHQAHANCIHLRRCLPHMYT